LFIDHRFRVQSVSRTVSYVDAGCHEGSPTPVTAFFATVSENCRDGIVCMVMHDAFGRSVDDWQQIVAFPLGPVHVYRWHCSHRTDRYQTPDGLFVNCTRGFSPDGLRRQGRRLGVQAMLVYPRGFMAMNIGTFSSYCRWKGRHARHHASLQMAQTSRLALAMLDFGCSGWLRRRCLAFFGKFYGPEGGL
jgi:NADH-quinone oxidoreductase subunit N